MTLTANEIIDAMKAYILLNDNEINADGGYNVQVEARSNNANSYDWQIYVAAGDFAAMCSMWAIGCEKVYDSKNGLTILEPFENYIKSLVDPISGEIFKEIYIHYEEKYDSIIMMLTGKNYTLMIDNNGNVQSW